MNRARDDFSVRIDPRLLPLITNLCIVAGITAILAMLWMGATQ